MEALKQPRGRLSVYKPLAKWLKFDNGTWDIFMADMTGPIKAWVAGLQRCCLIDFDLAAVEMEQKAKDKRAGAGCLNVVFDATLYDYVEVNPWESLRNKVVRRWLLNPAHDLGLALLSEVLMHDFAALRHSENKA